LENKLLALSMISVLLASVLTSILPLRLTSANPTEWHVYPGESVQAAINAASPGDTIIIHSGTYTEGPQIVIDKNLKIVGEDAATTIIKPTGDTGSTGDARGWFLVTTGVDLNLSNLTLDGSGYNIYQAIRHKGQGNVSNTFFKDIRYPTYYGFAIVVFGGNVDVVNSTFSNIGRVGVLFFGTVVSDSLFSENSYTGKGDGDWLDYGVEVGAGASVVIAGNTISGCTGIASVDGSTSAGVLVTTYYGAGSQATIINNDISSNTYGIAVGYDQYDTSFVVANMNNVYNNNWGIDSTAPTVDARFNWWGDASGPYHSVTNPSGLGNDVSDFIDYSPWLGATFETTPRTYHVNPTGTIQEAVDEASNGDTVLVHDGTYDEQVVIDKGLTLEGMGDPSIVKPSSDAKLTTILDGRWWGGGTKQVAGVIVANAAGSSVAVKNLKVDGDSITNKPTSADFVAGVFYRETAGSIDTVTVTNVRVGTSTAVRAYGIYLSAAAYTVSIEVKGTTITNFDKNGIEVVGNTLTANINGNTINGRGSLPAGDEVQNGILIADGAQATVDYNQISNMVYAPETWWSSGILFYDGSGSALGNTITQVQIGILLQDGDGVFQGNTISGVDNKIGLYAQYTKPGAWTASFVANTAQDSDFSGIGATTYETGASLVVTIDNNQLLGGPGDGIYIGDAPDYGPAGSITLTITNNFITGWQHGIHLLSSVASATITGNTVENNLGISSGIHIEPAVTVNNVHINFNNIAGNSGTGVYGIFNGGIGTLDAAQNWWGDPTGPYHPELNPSGRGDQASDFVAFEPWLIEPYPPPVPVEALIYVSPATTEYWTPSYGKTFTVEVKLDNVTDLFSYEFKLYWDTTLLDLVNVQITPPWPNYFVGKNEINEALGRYWLGITAIGTTFTGNAVLAKLTFKITYDPLYPENKACKLDLEDTILTAPFGEIIYHMTKDGTYSIYSIQPRIMATAFPSKVIALGDTVKVDISIADVVNLYEFSFKLGYNTTMLDVVSVEVNFLKDPYLYYYTINEAAGYVLIWAWALSPAPPANGTGVLAFITMKATLASIWPDPALTCSLRLYESQLKTKEGTQLLHTKIDGTYVYQPKPGDLNADGKVDLIDLRIVAYYYDPAYNRIADLNRDGIVNIIDLSIVASYYEE